MNNTNKSLLNYVAGVLSIIFSVLGIIWTFCFVQDAKLMYGISLDYFFYYFGVSFVCYLLALLSLLMIAILLFKGVRNTLLSVTVGLEALLKIVMYIDGKNRGDFYLNGSFFGIILLVFAYVGAAIYTYLIFSKKPISQKIKMFWFVPALLSGLSWVIGFFPYGCFF